MLARLLLVVPFAAAVAIGCGGAEGGGGGGGDEVLVQDFNGITVETRTVHNPDGTTSLVTTSRETPKEPYTSPDGNYRVAFPTPPKVSEQKQATPVGEQTLHNAVLVQGRKTWMVGWAAMPAEMLRGKPADEMFDRALDTSMNAQGWVVLQSNGTQIGPHPARDVKFEARSVDGGTPGLGWERMALIGDRLYQVMAIAPKEAGDGTSQSQFIHSFELVSDVPPLAPPEPKPAEPKPEATAAPIVDPTLVQAVWVDEAQDKVGENGPDGRNDDHVRIDVKLPNDTRVDHLVLTRHNAEDRWDSRSGGPPFAVYRGEELIVPGHAETLGVLSGDVSFDAYLSPLTPMEGGAKLDVVLDLTIGGEPHTIRGTCTKPGGPVAAPAPASAPAAPKGFSRIPPGRRGSARRR